MLRAVLVAGCLFAPGIAAAQQSAGCWHVIYANQGDIPATALRWNSCTGETWLLLEEEDVNKQGVRTGSHWYWFPVPVTTVPASGN